VLGGLQVGTWRTVLSGLISFPQLLTEADFFLAKIDKV